MNNKKSTKVDYIFKKILFWFLVGITIVGNVRLVCIEGTMYLKIFTNSFFWMSLIIIIGTAFLLGTLITHTSKKKALWRGLLAFFILWGCAGLGDYVNYIIFAFLFIGILYFMIYLRNNHGISSNEDQ